MQELKYPHPPLQLDGQQEKAKEKKNHKTISVYWGKKFENWNGSQNFLEAKAKGSQAIN